MLWVFGFWAWVCVDCGFADLICFVGFDWFGACFLQVEFACVCLDGLLTRVVV